jgi:cytochrome c biogenesis protein CcdA
MFTILIMLIIITSCMLPIITGKVTVAQRRGNTDYLPSYFLLIAFSALLLFIFSLAIYLLIELRNNQKTLPKEKETIVNIIHH